MTDVEMQQVLVLGGKVLFFIIGVPILRVLWGRFQDWRYRNASEQEQAIRRLSR